MSGAGAGANATNAITNTIEAGVIGDSSTSSRTAIVDIFATDSATVLATVVTAAANAASSAAARNHLADGRRLGRDQHRQRRGGRACGRNSGIDGAGNAELDADSTKTIEARFNSPCRFRSAISVRRRVILAGAFGVAR